MENRHRYITKHSEKILNTANQQYHLNIESDPQLHELLRGISILHASKQYEDQFAFQNALNNIKYNLDIEFDVAAHGLIQIQPSNSISIQERFIFRSVDCIYQTIKPYKFYEAKLINQSIINRYNRKFIELKIIGNISGQIEFFTHHELIDAIFQNNDEINILGFDGRYYRCKKETNGNIFHNLNCAYLSSFHINVHSNEQLTFYIPIESDINTIHNIYINCAILVNKFIVESIPSSQTIKLPTNTRPIKFNYIKNTLNEIIPHKRTHLDGWYITLNNNILFTNINQTSIVNMICTNIDLNTSTCQSEIFIPSVSVNWIVKPINNKTKNSIEYINSNALEMFEYFAQLCDIEYKNLTIEKTILSRIHDKKYYTYEYGEIISIELITNKYIFIKLIENEINKYHNVKILTTRPKT